MFLLTCCWFNVALATQKVLFYCFSVIIYIASLFITSCLWGFAPFMVKASSQFYNMFIYFTTLYLSLWAIFDRRWIHWRTHSAFGVSLQSIEGVEQVAPPQRWPLGCPIVPLTTLLWWVHGMRHLEAFGSATWTHLDIEYQVVISIVFVELVTGLVTINRTAKRPPHSQHRSFDIEHL